MNKKMIRSMLAVCMSVSMVGGMGVGTAWAEDTTGARTIVNEDFEDAYYSTNWGIPKFNIPGNLATSGTGYYYVKRQATDYYYNYNNTQQGDMRSYYTLPNMRYSGTYGSNKTSRDMIYAPDMTKEDWYFDIKLASYDETYSEMPVGALAQKGLDVSFLMAYRDDVTTGLNVVETTQNPVKIQLVFTSDSGEHVYDIGDKKINKSSNGTLNNGVHVRNSLAGIEELAAPYETASNIRVRVTSKVESDLKELSFDCFLVKEVNPKEVFSEDFEERPWFGYMQSTDFLTTVSVTDTIPGISTEGRGKVLKLETRQDSEWNHTIEFPIQNADPTKCYKVAFDMYFPESNTNTAPAVAYVRNRDSGGQFFTLFKEKKGTDFVHKEATFDFSHQPEGMPNSRDLRLSIVFGDDVHKAGDVMYLDNITVTEVPVRNIEAVQGTNYFVDRNTLTNGDLSINFRDTEEACLGIVAAYDADGRLVNVWTTDVSTDGVISQKVTVTDEIQKVSAFAWNPELGDQHPVMPAISVTKAE